MTNLTKRVSTKQTTEHVDFCVADAKGRSIGCAIIRRYVTFVPQDADVSWGSLTPAGDYIEVEVQATRDGKLYGASQSGKRWALAQADGAEPYITRRVADSRKAAEKKAAAL